MEPEEEEDRILDPVTGEVYLSTTQEAPIPMELLTGALPRAILATVEGTEETVTLGPWTCADYPAEGAYTGDYTFVTTLPEGYTLAEGVAALEVTVRFEEPEVLAEGTVNNETDLQNAINAGGNITVGADFNISRSITIGEGKNITLDLNGKTITYSGDDGSIFGASGVFTLDGGNFKVKNGTITKNGKQEYIRCFNVENGTLTIDGVTIKDFSCLKDDGAISIGSKGICNMESGTISGNSADGRKGGGVYVDQGGTFNMNGGTISGNNVSSGYGGGVYVGQGGTFTMKGGTISNNQAQSGGGVYVYTSGTFNMYNGTISGNRAQSGGGVEVYRNGSFTMEGGEIRKNQAENKSYGNGGGVAVHMGSFAMKGGTISGNTAKKNGGGVYVDKHSFTMSGGTISNNTANAAGGGVYMYNGSFTMSGGSITGNKAVSNGKGVYIEGIVSCQLSGGARITENTGNGTGNLYVMMGRELSITNLTTGAQLGICFSRPEEMRVATGDQESLQYLTCENEGYVFTLENSNELWVKQNRIKINRHPTGKEDLKYDGKSHELVDAGEAEEGSTMLYAVGTSQPKPSDFSEKLPSKTNAGTYTVWYYAQGVGNKADSDMKSLNVTIAQKPLGVNWTKTILTYNGWPQQPTATLTGKVDSNGVYLEISNKQTYVGNYTTGALSLSGGKAGNYVLADDVRGIDFTIQPASLTVTANPKAITYGDAPDNDGVTYDGFVRYGDENFLGGDLVYTYTYEQYGDVGRYEITPGGLTSKNYEITFVDGPLYVDQKPISINWGETTYTYDGNPWGPTPTAEGMENGDALTLTVTGQKTDAGDYTATVTGIQGDNAKNYKLPDNRTTPFTIDKAAPAVTEPKAKALTYNGSDQPLVTEGSSADGAFQYWLDGEQPGESIPQAKNAGKYTVYYQLMGDDNHENGTVGTIEVEIKKKDIAKANITLGARLFYNGDYQTQTVASVTVEGVTGEVTYNVTGNTGKDARTDYTMTLEGTGNFTGKTTKDWSIAPKNIRDASITLKKDPQTYTGQMLTNSVTDVTVDNLHLGNGDYTVSGKTEATDVGNYTLTVTGKGNFTGSASQDWAILQATDNDWTVEPSVTNCTYGETPTVTMGEAKYGAVTVNYTTKDGNTSLGETVPTDAGSYKAVFTVAGTVNYNDLSMPVDFTIAKAPLTVTANPKTITYGEKPDNNGVTYSGFVKDEKEDVLDGKLAYAYNYQQYGSVGDYEITPKGLTSGNYDITFTKGTLTVERKNVTIQGVAVEASKVYDGTANAAITDNGHLSANFDGENLTFQVGTAAYDDKNAGADKTVTFTGFRLEGPTAKNYQLTGQPEATTASITQKPAKLTVTAKNKTYDGTLTAKLDTVTHSGFVAGDDVQLVNGTPSFVSKDKGENIPVTCTPFTLTGPDAGNYALTQPTGVTARISPRSVTVSGITAQDKTYDGNTQVTFGYEHARLEGNVDGDKLTVTAEGSFEDANVGDKLVNITGLTLGGAEQGNYVLAGQFGGLLGNACRGPPPLPLRPMTAIWI